jgi:hypothetical protein
LATGYIVEAKGGSRMSKYFGHFSENGVLKDKLIPDIISYLDNTSLYELEMDYRKFEDQLTQDIRILRQFDRGEIVNKSQETLLQLAIEENSILCYRIRVYLTDEIIASSSAPSQIMEIAPSAQIAGS